MYNPLRERSGAILLDIDQKESFENPLKRILY